jgi:hypothetical protein
MAIIVWPATLSVGSLDIGIDFDVQINIKRSGGLDTYGLPGGRWTATLGFEPETELMKRPLIEALVISLSGGANRLQMHHLGRPIPNGTMRGAPTLALPVVAGATSLSLAGVNGTLKAGDIIGLPGQFFMVMADVSPVSNAMTVLVNPAVRLAATSGVTVTWNKPTTLWIPKSSSAGPFPYRPGTVRPGFSIDLIEAFA